MNDACFVLIAFPFHRVRYSFPQFYCFPDSFIPMKILFSQIYVIMWLSSSQSIDTYTRMILSDRQDWDLNSFFSRQTLVAFQLPSQRGTLAAGTLVLVPVTVTRNR
jgi:hypothetical protein